MSRFIKLPEVIHNNASCHAAVYAWINKGLYPSPIKVGRMSVWTEEEDAAVRAARIAGRSEQEIREIVAKLETAREDAFQDTFPAAA